MGKESELKSDSEMDSESKKERITIDPFFHKDDKYRHHLVIEKGEAEAESNPLGIRTWHRICQKGGTQYLREIRMEHKLFAVRPELKVDHYIQKPSPFSLPPQLVDVED